MGNYDRNHKKNEIEKDKKKRTASGERIALDERVASDERKLPKKKLTINENNLTKLLAFGVMILGIVIIGAYLYYFMSLDKLTDHNALTKAQQEESVSMPIMPYKAYSIKKEDLIATFGQGTQGEGVSQDTKYIDYTQNWFNIDANARYYYGKENRVYETILSYSENDTQAIYDNMVKLFGKPFADSYQDTTVKKREAFWIKDSVEIFLRLKSGKPEVEMYLSYYDNPNQFPLGDRPTVIQRINADVTGDGQTDAVLLIGTKSEYTTTIYKNLFLLVGNKDGAFYTVFPKETDGGESPALKMADIDADGKDDILISADQSYVMNYNGFKVEGNKIINIYSSDIDPLEKDVN